MINVNLLPKGSRRQGVNPYKLAAVAVPVALILGAGTMQFSAAQEQARLAALEAERLLERTVLQRFVDEQTELQSRRVSLAELQRIAEGVRQGRVIWSQQLFAMLETRPPQSETSASRISFRQLEMRALDPSTSAQLLADNTYEGLEAVAEMDVSGLAGSALVVADYVRELQTAPNFGVVLRDMAREQESPFYTFNMTIGAAALAEQTDAEQNNTLQNGASQGDAANTEEGAP